MTQPFKETVSAHKVRLSVALLVGLSAACWLFAPEQPPVQNLQSARLLGSSPVAVTPAALQQSATSSTGAKERYEEALAKGRELAKECRKISVNFFDSSLADSYEWKEKWPIAAKALSDHGVVFEKAAIDWFLECEKPSEDLLQLASAISGQTYERGDMDLSWKILAKVKEFFSDPDDITLNRRIAQVGLRSNRYQAAKDFLKMSGAIESVDALEENLDKNLFAIASLMQRNWEAEMEIRKKEVEADDLPRVKFLLSTGKEVVLELFENEAPETVANFISLVESGFYDGSFFHPCIKNIVAQTGTYNRSHNIAVDYVIKNESRSPNARKHFVGSLSMTSDQGGKDSGSTLFAITMVPNPDLDWEGSTDDKVSQPVFGRVFSGLEHVAALPVTVEIDEETQQEKMVKDMNPGYIEKATVIRKRDHEYTFRKKHRKVGNGPN